MDRLLLMMSTVPVVLPFSQDRKFQQLERRMGGGTQQQQVPAREVVSPGVALQLSQQQEQPVMQDQQQLLQHQQQQRGSSRRKRGAPEHRPPSTAGPATLQPGSSLPRQGLQNASDQDISLFQQQQQQQQLVGVGQRTDLGLSNSSRQEREQATHKRARNSSPIEQLPQHFSPGDNGAVFWFLDNWQRPVCPQRVRDATTADPTQTTAALNRAHTLAAHFSLPHGIISQVKRAQCRHARICRMLWHGSSAPEM